MVLLLFHRHYDCFKTFQGFNFCGRQVTHKNSENYSTILKLNTVSYHIGNNVHGMNFLKFHEQNLGNHCFLVSAPASLSVL